MPASLGRAPDSQPAPGLGAALVVSTVLHLTVLAQMSLPSVVRHAGGAIPLTVTIGDHRRPTVAEVQRREARTESPVATSQPILVARSGRDTLPARREDSTDAAESPKVSTDAVDAGTHAQAPTAGQIATRVRQTEPAPSALLPGHARVLLLVGPSGTIEQIIWEQLPPLDDSRFRELERRVRDRHYPEADAPRKISEVINVLAILRAD